jgi:hypothetical protein
MTVARSSNDSIAKTLYLSATVEFRFVGQGQISRIEG